MCVTWVVAVDLPSRPRHVQERRVLGFHPHVVVIHAAAGLQEATAVMVAMMTLAIVVRAVVFDNVCMSHLDHEGAVVHVRLVLRPEQPLQPMAQHIQGALRLARGSVAGRELSHAQRQLGHGEGEGEHKLDMVPSVVVAT